MKSSHPYSQPFTVTPPYLFYLNGRRPHYYSLFLLFLWTPARPNRSSLARGPATPPARLPPAPSRPYVVEQPPPLPSLSSACSRQCRFNFSLHSPLMAISRHGPPLLSHQCPSNSPSSPINGSHAEFSFAPHPYSCLALS
jgi:hypothetical protein